MTVMATPGERVDEVRREWRSLGDKSPEFREHLESVTVLLNCLALATVLLEELDGLESDPIDGDPDIVAWGSNVHELLNEIHAKAGLEKKDRLGIEAEHFLRHGERPQGPA